MAEGYKTVYYGGTGEIIEKKSRFIATVQPVESEEEAVEFIADMKKKYWDARHNCSAFVIGNHSQLTRCSDDGEPSGTAGKPMLEVLLGEQLTNCAVVVTRYFGGTLLGTGGLVRAYTQAVQEGLRSCTLIEKKPGFQTELVTDYNGVGKIQYLLAQEKISILNSEYTQNVVLSVIVPKEEKDRFEKKVTEATSGRWTIRVGEMVFYAQIDDKVLLFDA